MRIAILTQPLRFNYGGILQNFALQTILKRMGHDVVTLDPQRYTVRYKWQYAYFFVRHIVGIFYRGLNRTSPLAEYRQDRDTKTMGKNTFLFIDKYICRREYQNLNKDLESSEYDAFIVGSDQVWRCLFNKTIENMFLDFTKGWRVRRVAYAASFGTDKWNGTEQQTSICRKALNCFDVVTVREDTGIKLCKEVFGVEAKHVLDPTLLLSKEDYIKELQLERVEKSQGDLLVYILNYNDENSQLIDSFIHEGGYTPFRVNSEYENRRAPIESRIQPPVENWVRGFMDAEYVVTDSFHACVFALIFRKQFWVYGNPMRGMSRYLSLFNQLGIGNRMVCSIEDIKNLPSIDYMAFETRLRYLQKESVVSLLL